MKKQYYFISGLPRSGSTMLSAILRQNPNFHADISDNLFGHIMSVSHVENETKKIPLNEIRKNMIHGMFDGYYKHVDESVVFNTNRGWTAQTHILKYLYPNTKMIVCVRDILSVVNSIESAHRKNLLKGSATTGPIHTTVYDRVKEWMGEHGFVNSCYNNIKQSLYSNETDMLLFVEYDDLCKNPEATLRRIYDFIEKPYFEHDFQNIENDESWKKFDEHIGIELHTVHKEIFYKERKSIIPIDAERKLKDLEVWRDKYPKLYS